jgi:hypothetical protein
MKYKPITMVGARRSVFTGARQVYAWPGQLWAVEASLPPIKDAAEADAWVAWKLSLNGQEGTFNLGPSTRKSPRSTWAGSVQIGAGVTAMSTTVVFQGGSGTPAVGDWFQVGTNLHRVVKVNSATNVDVWPRTRSAYAQTTAVVITNPKGLFCLMGNDMEWTVDLAQHTSLSLNAIEAL